MSGVLDKGERWRVVHGDCIDVLRTLPDASVDAVVTDPPYKISQEYGTTTDPDNLLAVSSLWPVAAECLRVTRPGGLCAMFYDTRILPLALRAMPHAGWKYLRALTLYRRWGNASKLYGWMTTSDLVLIFCRPGAKYAFHGDTHHDVFVRSHAEEENAKHPAQKPVAFAAQIVANLCPPGGVVLDPYAGSGTTGVACAQKDRRFVGIEQDAGYCEIAHRRIAAAAAQPALLFAESAAEAAEKA
jgi:DNA modification methylase